jgi:hypothetical protein
MKSQSISQRFFIKICCLSIGVIAISLQLKAQDTHYNTVQFGTRSALMGGAVVGNIKDNTAVFYNPGGMGFIDSSTLSINGNAYQIDNIKIYNAIGKEKNFKSSSLGSVPLFIGGIFSKKENKLKLGYSVMSAVDFGFKATARLDDKVQVVNDVESPGEEEFIGQSSINSKLSELVFGIGGGYRLSPRWSVGFSNIITVRSQTVAKATYTRFFLNQPSTPLVSSSFVRSADYYNVRYAPRIGVNYQEGNFSAGLTITLPSISIMGNGTITADIIGNNILYNGSRTSLLANDRQEKLKSTFKSPLAVTAGINWRHNKSSIGVAAQYFGEIGIYDILKAAPSAFVRPAAFNTSLGSEQFLRLKTAAKSVFNIAVGYEYEIRPNLLLSGSIRTNGSYFDNNLLDTKGIRADLTTWDIYHFTAGTTFSRGRSKMTLGLLFSTGTDNSREETGDLTNPDEGNFLQGSSVITKATYSSIGLLIGYAFALKSNK